MIENYKCIMKDTYDKLKLGKIYKIKSIVTKEQFESMKYKVGD